MHPLAQVPGKGRQSLPQLVQPPGELSLARPLVHVGIPPRDVRERHLEPDIGPDELGDLEEGFSELPARIIGPIRGSVLAGVQAFQHLDGVA